MPAMIDAVVLIHALGVEIGRIDASSKYWEDARASHDLVEQADALVLSAIAWFEVMRGMTDDQQEVLAKWRSHLQVVPVDARVAQRAAEIHAASRGSGKLCQRCLGFLEATTCTACGNQRAATQRSNDIVMVATADVDPDIRVLYSWDGGVLALGEHTPDLQIRNPPPPKPEQINLDGTTDIRKARAARGRRPAKAKAPGSE